MKKILAIIMFYGVLYNSNAQNITFSAGVNRLNFLSYNNEYRNRTVNQLGKNGFIAQFELNDFLLYNKKMSFILKAENNRGEFLETSTDVFYQSQMIMNNYDLSIIVYPFQYNYKNILKFRTGLEAGFSVFHNAVIAKTRRFEGNMKETDIYIRNPDDIVSKTTFGISNNMAFYYPLKNNYALVAQYSFYLGLKNSHASSYFDNIIDVKQNAQIGISYNLR